MNDEIMDLLEIRTTSDIEFRKIYGFTFAFKSTFFTSQHNIISAEIKPLGIIYEENDDFYFAPLDKVDKKDKIIEKFVDEFLI